MDLGDRQLGRVCAPLVCHSAPKRKALKKTMNRAISKQSQLNALAVISAYGTVETGAKILGFIKTSAGPFSNTCYDVEISK